MEAASIKGFSVPKKLPNRVVASIAGHVKTGKTYLSLTAPRPAAVINTDRAMHHAVNSCPAGNNQLLVADVWFDPTHDSGDEDFWKKKFSEYRTLLRDALHTESIRTVILDKAGDLWTLARLAMLHRLTSVKPIHYVAVNAAVSALIKEVYTTDKNLLLIHGLKQVYENDKATDKLEIDGFKDVPAIVEVNVRTDFTDGEFRLTIENCAQDPALFGEVLSGEMCTFPYLAMMLYPSSDAEEWQ